MPGRRRRVGLEHGTLLAGSAALLGLLVLGMGAPRNWWTRTLELRFRTDSAGGLQPGMAVKISGYPVGQVDRIQLLNDARVQVSLTIAASREGLIGRRSRATLAQEGLLGKAYIAISPDLQNHGPRQALKPGDTLPYNASPDLSTLIREVAASRQPLQNLIGRSEPDRPAPAPVAQPAGSDPREWRTARRRPAERGHGRFRPPADKDQSCQRQHRTEPQLPGNHPAGCARLGAQQRWPAERHPAQLAASAAGAGSTNGAAGRAGPGGRSPCIGVPTAHRPLKPCLQSLSSPPCRLA